ncbi:MAG: hypothetical protein UX04_C0006G0071 [Microgenomates group bacterium GW2011_GWF2_45_18]|nr:MAG: hypothetical protein UW18_C0006G0071 [Microgenomates group bacterium GW2011_GWF1_44_10]KKU01536.1 MAG: hypothetical protein UX04_C0006G0071 [Microgenomates group bacterium GW2011_GWF2_45_18]OGJ41415.1 MAG: hypothetical protein A2378_00125 [Candidatus Pacebacteria bacterium RIFOXYB1_FULL_44_10]HAU99444.1 hypothetical protein [Candidatus Paceibacterota bacterium]HAX01550.1 hypothetical protein [Candidatus Paceibacterota bacterium]
MNDLKLPLELHKYFWDVRIDQMNIQEKSSFVISRILEHGDIPDYRWLIQQYGKPEIIRVIKTSANISPKTANAFCVQWEIPREDVRCLQPGFLNPQNSTFNI